MSLKEKKESIIEELQFIDDPNERFSYIIDRARESESLKSAYKIDTFLIEGCMSKLWLYPQYEEGLCLFSSDADSVITKGIASLLCDLYSGSAPEEIMKEDASFLANVGITQHLTPNRRNGLTNLIKKIQAYAEHCLKDTA